MTPKYSTNTDESDGTRWNSDRRYVLHEWTSKPFLGHRHRHEEVHHRIVIEYSHGVGVDICHEAKSDDSGKFPDEWAPIETIEVREYGAQHTRRPQTKWLD